MIDTDDRKILYSYMKTTLTGLTIAKILNETWRMRFYVYIIICVREYITI